jgi:hypothetical protein
VYNYHLLKQDWTISDEFEATLLDRVDSLVHDFTNKSLILAALQLCSGNQTSGTSVTCANRPVGTVSVQFVRVEEQTATKFLREFAKNRVHATEYGMIRFRGDYYIVIAPANCLLERSDCEIFLGQQLNQNVLAQLVDWSRFNYEPNARSWQKEIEHATSQGLPLEVFCSTIGTVFSKLSIDRREYGAKTAEVKGLVLGHPMFGVLVIESDN